MNIPKPKDGIRRVSMSAVFQNALNCFRFFLKIKRLPQYNMIPRIKGKRRLYGFLNAIVGVVFVDVDCVVVEVCGSLVVVVVTEVVVDAATVPILNVVSKVVASPLCFPILSKSVVISAPHHAVIS